MRLNRTIEIAKPATEVWQVIAIDFDKACDWMAAVPKSYKIEEGDRVEGSPMVGRICEFSKKVNGPYAHERITYFNEENKELHIEVIPKNGNIPVLKNNVTAIVKETAEGKTEVFWNSDLQLKTVGKVLQPMLKGAIGKSFAELLEELKYYVEEGKPHPRKS